MPAIPNRLSGLLERTALFGYGAQLPAPVRDILAEHEARAADRDVRTTARLLVQGTAAVFLIFALAFHLAEVGIIGLTIIVLQTAFNGVTEEARLGRAFEAAMPFTGLLVVFFGIVAVIYLVVNLAYSLGLKQAVILDVLLLSMGFVLRAVGGVAVIRTMLPDVYLSYWLILCAFLLSLFLALAKRRHEIALLGEAAASHRASLANYSLTFIDQMLSALAAATLVDYSLYTISDDTVHRYGTRALFWTLPFVVYGLFRYLYLIYNRGEGGDPSKTSAKGATDAG